MRPRAHRLTYDQPSIRSPVLSFNGLQPRKETWITTHLATPEGWKAELAWLVDHSGHLTYEVVTYVNHRLWHRPGKVRQPEIDA